MTKTLLDPAARMLGGYLSYDGGVEFFGRVATVLKRSDVIVDLAPVVAPGSTRTAPTHVVGCATSSRWWPE